jgi:hypothetical protein
LLIVLLPLAYYFGRMSKMIMTPEGNMHLILDFMSMELFLALYAELTENRISLPVPKTEILVLLSL